MTVRTAVVTNSSSGLGAEMTRVLALSGARVVCRGTPATLARVSSHIRSRCRRFDTSLCRRSHERGRDRCRHSSGEAHRRMRRAGCQRWSFRERKSGGPSGGDIRSSNGCQPDVAMGHCQGSADVLESIKSRASDQLCFDCRRRWSCPLRFRSLCRQQTRSHRPDANSSRRVGSVRNHGERYRTGIPLHRDDSKGPR